MSNNLVQIGKSAVSQRFRQRIARGPIADKFFALALLAGLFGSTFLGVHLWFMRRGVMAPWRDFYDYRELHAVVQLYLFFGMFILGFVLQAMPKLLATRPFPAAVLLLGPVAVAGVLLRFLLGPGLAANLVLAAPFLVVFWLLGARMRHAGPGRLLSIGVPVLMGLGVIAAAAFLQIDDAAQAAFVFWGGIASVLFGAGQQFISTALGGRALSMPMAGVFLALHCAGLTVLGLFVFLAPHDPYLRIIVAVLLFAELLAYVVGTGLIAALLRGRSSPMRIAFGFGYFWALVSAVVAGLPGSRFDAVLHLWALGWVFPIVVAVSAQVINFLADRSALNPKVLAALLLCWQYIPLDRGLDLSSRATFTWADGLVVSVVFAYWGWGMMFGFAAILRRQFVMARDAAALNC